MVVTMNTAKVTVTGLLERQSSTVTVDSFLAVVHALRDTAPLSGLVLRESTPVYSNVNFLPPVLHVPVTVNSLQTC
jgi:hypothetical protein